MDVFKINRDDDADDDDIKISNKTSESYKL